MVTTKLIYDFRDEEEVGAAVLGGKGNGLSRMTKIGIPVPPGFVVSIKAHKEFEANDGKLADSFWQEFSDNIAELEKTTGKKFGSTTNPLLVSVRSGAPISMPGMMDTILNIGLNDDSVEALATASGNRHFAFDSYRRLLQMYGEVVTGIARTAFEAKLDEALEKVGSTDPAQLSVEALEQLVESFKVVMAEESPEPFPQDPVEQVRQCVLAVFRSWNGRRAVTYRNMEGIPHDLGTAANVQTMVFGNLGDDSGTGVFFTRNPSTGESGLYGEFLQSAQGEDVVSGVRTPEPLSDMSKKFPQAYTELEKHAETLEQYNKDMQDIEFTIEGSKLFVLQTRNGKRTAKAGVRLAVEMVEEGLITKEQAVMRVDPTDLLQLLLPQLAEDHGMDIAGKGLGASPGAAIGKIALDADVAVEQEAAGEKVILVRPETSPDDIHGFIASEGILTAKGGLTSHAAVVARGMGKPCITGCTGLDVDLVNRKITLNGLVLEEGTVITIDGTSGSVIIGQSELVPASTGDELGVLLEWADSVRKLKIYANADTPQDAETARGFGAEGIGLCRTEHMFFGEDRLPKMQAMILADNDEDRAAALDLLQPIQTEDFVGIFSTLGEYPVIIRLLDPPLHEFLPNRDEVESEEIIKRIDELQESNPMLGMRGCRLGLTYPAIYEMQIKAIADAILEVHKQKGEWPKVQIMLPMVGFRSEMVRLRENVSKILADRSVENVPIGMMIELPRAAIVASEYTDISDFFSFGTNDLTQTTLGYSRDDAENTFMPTYMEEGLLENNPFETLDINGVGALVDLAVSAVNGKDGKNLDMSFGACGEHGGDPDSIHFFHKVGLNYVSCSPFRIPTARLAAAQAALE